MSEFPLPDWLEYAREPWDEWVAWRKKIRKPLTNYAAKLAVRKLYSLWEQGNDPKEVIEQSVLCGYQGLFQIHSGRADRRDDEVRREVRAGAGPAVKH